MKRSRYAAMKLNSSGSSDELKVNQPIKPRAAAPAWPRLGTVLCRQLAFAFQLSSPILLVLSSCFLLPVSSLSLQLS